MLLAYMNPPGSAEKILLKFHNIQESSTVISVEYLQLGYGLVKRLVGLGRFELDHPALQCSLFCFFFFMFCFLCRKSVISSLLTAPDIGHWFKYSFLLIAACYTSSSSSLSMTLLAYFPGFGMIANKE